MLNLGSRMKMVVEIIGALVARGALTQLGAEAEIDVLCEMPEEQLAQRYREVLGKEPPDVGPENMAKNYFDSLRPEEPDEGPES